MKDNLVNELGDLVNDCISRQAALDAMETWDKFGCDPDGKLVRYDDDKHYIPYVHYEDMVHAIKHLPSAQPGWIPCSRELPKNKSYVLTIIYIPGRQAHIRSGWYEDGIFLNDNGDTWNATDKEVVGWMYQPKLPKPYREWGQDE